MCQVFYYNATVLLQNAIVITKYDSTQILVLCFSSKHTTTVVSNYALTEVNTERKIHYSSFPNAIMSIQPHNTMLILRDFTAHLSRNDY